MVETIKDNHLSTLGHTLPDEKEPVSSVTVDSSSAQFSKGEAQQESRAVEYRGDRPIIFFDGDCVMCNGFVDLLLAIDRKGLFYLSPLQGKSAAQYLPPLPDNREEWSIYYLSPHDSSSGEGAALYSQSDAVLQICQHLGGVWALAGVGNGIPAIVRDAVYRLVARNRYRLLGRRSTCRVPTEAEQSRFLP